MKVIDEIRLARYVIQEREYEYMQGDGTQIFGPWRVIASKWHPDDARHLMRKKAESNTDREYRILDTKEPTDD